MLNVISINKKILIASFVIAIIGFALIHPSKSYALSGSDFKAGHIIDDLIFLNNGSMSVQNIQNFLNAKVPSCDTYGTQPSEYGGGTRAQWAAANGKPQPPYICLKNYATSVPSVAADSYCGAISPSASMTAAQIIKIVSDACVINPQVMIVLLQKEQGLVTDTWPWPIQYKFATGYCVYDTAPPPSCAGTDGFFNQIYYGARQFKKYLANNGAPGVFWIGNYRIPYNPDGSCDSSIVNIQNGATAALYDYTPYQPNAAALAGVSDNSPGGTVTCGAYGNRNFWWYFNEWFGLTTYYEPTGALLLYQTSTNKVFLATSDDKTRYYVSSWSLLQNYRLERYQIITVSDSVINSYADGGNLTNLVWDNSGVYLVNNATKYHFPGPSDCTNWGYDCSDNTIVKQLGSSFQSSYLTAGSNLGDLAQYSSTFYKLEAGKRRTISTTQTLSSLGYVPQAALYLSAYNNSQKPLGDLLISNSTPIKFNGSASIYYVEGGTSTPRYHPVGSPDLLSAWGIRSVYTPPASAYDTTPPTTDPTALNQWYTDGTNKYLIDQGRKILLSASQQQLWPSASFQTKWSQLAAGLPAVNLGQFATDGRSVYSLGSDNKKHHVPTYDDYMTLGITTAKTTSISAANLVLVASGNDALGNGKLIGISGQAGIYVINSHAALHVPDTNTFNLFGFSWGKIYTYGGTIFNDYPQAGDLMKFKTTDGSYSYILSKWRLTLSPQTAANFGLNTSSFTALSGYVTKNLSPGIAVSKFIYNVDTGKIYYASGGSLHYVQNYSSFVAYGGLSTPATNVNSDFISNFAIGQNI